MGDSGTRSRQLFVPPALEYDDPLLNDLECSICYDKPRDPVCVTCCGCDFCEDCLVGIKQAHEKAKQQYDGTGTTVSDELSCPHCRQPKLQWVPARGLRSIIAKANAICTGCKATFNFSDAAIHWETCPAIRFPCPMRDRGCTWFGERSAEEAHLRDSCHYTDAAAAAEARKIVYSDSLHQEKIAELHRKIEAREIASTGTIVTLGLTGAVLGQLGCKSAWSSRRWLHEQVKEQKVLLLRSEAEALAAALIAATQGKKKPNVLGCGPEERDAFDDVVVESREELPEEDHVHAKKICSVSKGAASSGGAATAVSKSTDTSDDSCASVVQCDEAATSSCGSFSDAGGTNRKTPSKTEGSGSRPSAVGEFQTEGVEQKVDEPKSPPIKQAEDETSTASISCSSGHISHSFGQNQEENYAPSDSVLTDWAPVNYLEEQLFMLVLRPVREHRKMQRHDSLHAAALSHPEEGLQPWERQHIPRIFFELAKVLCPQAAAAGGSSCGEEDESSRVDHYIPLFLEPFIVDKPNLVFPIQAPTLPGEQDPLELMRMERGMQDADAKYRRHKLRYRIELMNFLEREFRDELKAFCAAHDFDFWELMVNLSRAGGDRVDPAELERHDIVGLLTFADLVAESKKMMPPAGAAKPAADVRYAKKKQQTFVDQGEIYDPFSTGAFSKFPGAVLEPLMIYTLAMAVRNMLCPVVKLGKKNHYTGRSFAAAPGVKEVDSSTSTQLVGAFVVDATPNTIWVPLAVVLDRLQKHYLPKSVFQYFFGSTDWREFFYGPRAASATSCSDKIRSHAKVSTSTSTTSKRCGRITAEAVQHKVDELRRIMTLARLPVQITSTSICREVLGSSPDGPETQQLVFGFWHFAAEYREPVQKADVVVEGVGTL